MQAAGLLLTGGKSRRLGIDKSTLVVREGETLVERSARVLTEACRVALEVGPGASRLPVVVEDPPGGGPLVAVGAGAAALRARGHDGPVIVLAVDLPSIEPALLRWLAEHPTPGTLVPRVEGRAQSLCARYAPDALAVAEQLAAEGERSMRSLLAAVEVAYLDEDAWGSVCDARVFADVDTPADLARLGIAMPPE